MELSCMSIIFKIRLKQQGYFLEAPTNFLSGEGAMRFIKKHFTLIEDSLFINPYSKYVKDHFEKPIDMFNLKNKFGTVGCVARDIFGNIAAGTSTGGVPNSEPGRVGDSCIAGAGVYANDKSGGVSCTGCGEEFLMYNLGIRTSMLLKKMKPMKATKFAIRNFQKKSEKCLGGVITISNQTGEYGLFHNTEYMPFALLNENGTITNGLSLKDLKDFK